MSPAAASGREILEELLEEHARLRDRLRDWDAALSQTIGSTYSQSQHAVNVLRELCRFMEHQSRHHFHQEETVLYAAIEYKLPRLRGLVGELRHDHDVFRQAFEDFRRELIHFNATGELRHLPRLGRELVRLLRHHVGREERELHPLLLQEFTSKDWAELHRLFTE